MAFPKRTIEIVARDDDVLHGLGPPRQLFYPAALLLDRGTRDYRLQRSLGVQYHRRSVTFPECLVAFRKDKQGCTKADIDEFVRGTIRDFASEPKVAGTGVYSRNGSLYLETLYMWAGSVYVHLDVYEARNHEVLQYARSADHHLAIKFLAMSPKVDVEDGEVLWDYDRRRTNRNSLYGANGERYKGDEPTTLVQGRRGPGR